MPDYLLLKQQKKNCVALNMIILLKLG